jgi:hypothetical protein
MMIFIFFYHTWDGIFQIKSWQPYSRRVCAASLTLVTVVSTGGEGKNNLKSGKY